MVSYPDDPPSLSGPEIKGPIIGLDALVLQRKRRPAALKTPRFEVPVRIPRMF